MAAEEQAKVECLHQGISAEQKLKPRGMVYAIQSGDDGPIKFGITTGPPESRMDNLQTGNPLKLRLISCIIPPGTGKPTNADIEMAIHAICRKHHIRGEWFKPSSLVLGIANLLGDEQGMNHVLMLWSHWVSVYAGPTDHTNADHMDDMIRWAYRYRPGVCSYPLALCHQ